MSAVEVVHGVPAGQVAAAAALYDQAFGAKLRPAIPDDEARLRVLLDAINPSRGIVALADGEVVGLAGYHDRDGSLTSAATFSTLHRHLGLVGAVRAAALLTLLERRPESDELLMDGIAVRADHRGRGIGSRLFDALEAHGRACGLTSIRLDVVDTNPDARRLYERRGFVAVRTERTPYLRRLMGFSNVTTMVLQL